LGDLANPREINTEINAGNAQLKNDSWSKVQGIPERIIHRFVSPSDRRDSGYRQSLDYHRFDLERRS
jgi:hypothetical protein